MPSLLTLAPDEFEFCSTIVQLEEQAYNTGQAGIILSGVIGPVGTVVPAKVGSTGSKSVAGAITPVGDVPQITVALDSMYGVVGPVGTLQVATRGSTSQGSGGSIGPIGTCTVKAKKTFSGIISPIGTFAKVPRKILVGTITPVGTSIATTSFNATSQDGAIGPVGECIVKVRLTLGGTIGPSSPPVQIATAAVPGRQVGGTIGPVGVITKVYVRKVLQGFIGPTGLGDPHKVGAPPPQPTGSIITYRRRRR